MKLTVEIDSGSGFCFGVTTAIKKAEEQLASSGSLYCLGDIVHNGIEVERLHEKGLITINHDQLSQLHSAKVLLRAHGEPPETYECALRNDIEIIDATCPVVLRLKRRIKSQYESNPDAQIVIFGKNGHAEVMGLVGQTNHHAIVIESYEEATRLDFTRDIYLYSQTTKSLDEYHRIIDRMAAIAAFAKRHDVVVFVSGRKSSNGRVLFNECQRVNPRSHLVEGPDGIQPEWFRDANTVGICGATSTPKWLMERCKARIENLQ